MSSSFHVVSLDGGGTKLICYYLFLKHLHSKVLTNPPSETYQLVVGTSAGAMVGALLAFDMLFEVEKTGYFSDLVQKFFADPNPLAPILAPKYKGQAKKKTLQETFGEMRMGQAKTMFCVVCSHLNGEPRLVTSWGDPDVLVADALDASSAAPIFFPPVKIDGQFLVDGGLVHNNPIMIAFVVAAETIQSTQTSSESYTLLPCSVCSHVSWLNMKILSLGNGIKAPIVITNDEFVHEMGLPTCVAMGLTDAFVMGDDTVSCKAISMVIGKENVLRINSGLSAPLDEFDLVSNLSASTNLINNFGSAVAHFLSKVV